MSFVLAVSWVAKPGNETRIKQILQALEPASRQEPGVISYTTHVDPEDARQFFIYEVYRDANGLEAHQQTEHFKELVLEQALPLLETRERKSFVTLSG